MDSPHGEFASDNAFESPHNTTSPLWLYGANWKTLLHATDQVGESVHHSVKQFIDCHSNYNQTDKSTEEYGEDILTGVKHFNANNIGSIWW